MQFMYMYSFFPFQLLYFLFHADPLRPITMCLKSYLQCIYLTSFFIFHVKKIK